MEKKVIVLWIILILIIAAIFNCGCTSSDEDKKEAGKTIDIRTGEMYFTDYIIDDSGYTSTPPSNYKWFVIEVTVINNGKSETNVNPNYFTLIDTNTQTYTYDWESFSFPDAMTHTNIEPGASYTSKFLFELPKDASPSKLIFDNYKQKKEISISAPNIKSKFNKPPIADAGMDQTVYLNSEVTLDGSESSDPEGGMGFFEWDYGDDSLFTGSGKTVTHTYLELGTFTVTLTVTDGCGLSDIDSITITVIHYFDLTIGEMEYTDRIGNEYPAQPEEGNKFFVIYVTVKNNDDKSHYISCYDFTLEDTNKNTYDNTISSKVENGFDGSDVMAGGSISGNLVFEITKSSIPSILYCEEASSSIDSKMIVENYNQPPTANADKDQTVFLDDEITLDGSKSSDPEEGDLDFEWDYGDDTSYTGSGEVETHTYDELGKFTVTLTVTDDCGLLDTDKTTITVIHYFELTIIAHGWHEATGPYDFHEGDYEVTITMKNICTETKTVWGTFFEIITSDNIGYDWGGDDDNDPDSLGSGASATWTIYFDVPEGKTPMRIIYYDDLVAVL